MAAMPPPEVNMADERDGTSTGIDGQFFRIVATFEAAAMQQLGKIASPLTGDVEIDLGGVRDSIDMLDMLRRKTEGNLNEDEKRLIDHVLYQLRMNFLEVSKEEQAKAAAPNAGPGSERGDARDGEPKGDEPASEEPATAEPASGDAPADDSTHDDGDTDHS
jgi:hypothetical protein